MKGIMLIGLRKWPISISFRYGGWRTSFMLTVADFMAQAISLILSKVWRYRKQVIITNLKNAFPGYSAQEQGQMLSLYYDHIADLIVETFMLASLSRDRLQRLARYQNTDLLADLFNSGRDVILMASHYGNWEYLLSLPLITNYRVVAAYSPLSNKFLDQKMKGLRSRYGVTLIDKKDYYRFILREESSQPTLYVLITDQRPGAYSKKKLTFLNQKTFVHAGAQRIAARLDGAVVYLDVVNRKRHFYDYRFELMTDNIRDQAPEKLIKDYYKLLENTIQRKPELWLWSHRRWKVVPEAPCLIKC